MKDRFNFRIPAKMVLFLLTLTFLALLVLSFFKSSVTDALQNGINAAIMPMQKGLNQLGSQIFSEAESLAALKKAQEENVRLKEQLAALQEEKSLSQRDKYELETYRELFKLDQEYSQYEKVGARVIGKDSGKWFHSFLIDKGSDDGLAKDMVVIAQGGLVGIITAVGPRSARVMSIIDDESNITAMSENTRESFVVSGDLELYEDGMLRVMYIDKESEIGPGDKIITSNISSVYLPGILIGYIDEIAVDSNNMTKSGTLIPVVDFEHLETVLVITTLKNTGDDIIE